MEELRPKLRIVKIIFIGLAAAIVGLIGFSSWDEVTPTHEANTPQESIENSAGNNSECDIKYPSGKIVHLTSEPCAQYLKKRQNDEAAWQSQKQIAGTPEAPVVPSDWKTYSSTRFGISMRYPSSGYQIKADYDNVLIYASKIGPTAPESNEFRAEWSVLRGNKVCVADAVLHEGEADQKIIAWMEDPSIGRAVTIGGLQGKILLSSRQLGMYQYEAYVKRADADLWYKFSLSANNESEALFDQLLAGVSLTDIGDIPDIENNCK